MLRGSGNLQTARLSRHRAHGRVPSHLTLDVAHAVQAWMALGWVGLMVAFRRFWALSWDFAAVTSWLFSCRLSRSLSDNKGQLKARNRR